jgi:hypothetical protein
MLKRLGRIWNEWRKYFTTTGQSALKIENSGTFFLQVHMYLKSRPVFLNVFSGLD